MYTYPRPPNLAYPARVLSTKGRLLEATSSADRARAWPYRGAPERSTGWVAKVERREALRPTSRGARGWRYQLREAKRFFASGGVPLAHPGASRRSILSRG